MPVHTCEVFLFARKNEWAYGDEPAMTVRPSFCEDPLYDGEFLIASKTVAIQYSEVSDKELTLEAVQALQRTVSKEENAHAMRIKDLEDRIKSLLALPAPEAGE